MLTDIEMILRDKIDLHETFYFLEKKSATLCTVMKYCDL